MRLPFGPSCSLGRHINRPFLGFAVSFHDILSIGASPYVVVNLIVSCEPDLETFGCRHILRVALELMHDWRDNS